MPQIKNTEVIVIGAGPSGLGVAKLLGNANIETIVIEKGDSGSAKNFFSGIINKTTYESVFDKIDTSTERQILEHRAYILTQDTSTYINHRNKNEDYFSILRTPFNSYLSQTVRSSRVNILHKKAVRDLIVKDGKICGIKTDEEEFYSNIVVIAEGANSILTKHSGLRAGDFTSSEVFLFVEENIVLSKKCIEERLNLENGQGIAAKFFTNSYFDAPSIAFMHTNKDSISLSTGVLLSKTIASGININQYHEKLKEHKVIKPIVSDGTVSNYNSYVLPVPTNIFAQRVHANGCLIVGGASSLVNLLDWDLSHLSLLSAKCAAETIIRARHLNNYSEKTLSHYKKALTNLLKEEFNFSTLLQNEKIDLSNLLSRSA